MMTGLGENWRWWEVIEDWRVNVPVTTIVPTFAADEAAAAARPRHAVGAAVAVAAVPVSVAFGPVLPVVAALALGDGDELCRLSGGGAEDGLEEVEEREEDGEHGVRSTEGAIAG